MILISTYLAFWQYMATVVTGIDEVFIVHEESDLASSIRDIEAGCVILFAVIPSTDIEATSTDDYEEIESCNVFLVKKSDRGGLTHAEYLAELEVTQAIISHQLTSRESTWLTGKFLSSGSKQEQAYLLSNPKEAIAKATNETEIYDSRLGKQGNRILKSIEMLYSQQHIFIGQYSDAKADQLSVPEMILLSPNLKRIYDKSETIQLLIRRKAASHER